jgi:hypothetical protein
MGNMMIKAIMDGKHVFHADFGLRIPKGSVPLESFVPPQ